ncbi:hypothetical protein [Hydrogenimonas sp.]
MRIFTKALLVAAALTFGLAASDAMPSKRVASGERFTMEVESVDYPSSTVVLRGRGSERRTIHVDKSRHNLRKIRPGDWLEVETYEEVAIASSKERLEPASESHHDLVAGPRSKAPTLTATEVERIRARVVAVDHKNRTMVLESVGGAHHTFHIKPGVAYFENLHPGDTVTVTITKRTEMRIRPIH